MKLSKKGALFICQAEEFVPRLYNDAAGHATIGFGHLVHKGPINGTEPEEFKKGISRERALEIFLADAAPKEEVVTHLVKVPITQDQFDALVSFAFNCGEGALAGSSALKAINEGRMADVPAALALWNKAGGKVLPGLVKRRADEGSAFA